ncbi:DNA damage-inducible protein 1 [Hordeum vulgare]|nr:DNA damage-inducible protein 1 [Hordeum vulgare]
MLFCMLTGSHRPLSRSELMLVDDVPWEALAPRLHGLLVRLGDEEEAITPRLDVAVLRPLACPNFIYARGLESRRAAASYARATASAVLKMSSPRRMSPEHIST